MRTTSLFVITSALLTASTAMAQPIGIFRWQTQPYCNVLNIHVTQQAGVYSLDGIDDRCGGAEASASVVGVASSTAGGSTRLGLTIVMPGATPIHIEATIDVSLNGAWRDSAGNSGPFVLTPNARAPGAPRPVPSAGLAPASVTSAKIATAAVGPWHIAEQSVSGAHIVDGSLKSEELFDPPQTIGTVGEYPSHLESGVITFRWIDLVAPAAGHVVLNASGNFSFSAPQSPESARCWINHGLLSESTGDPGIEVAERRTDAMVLVSFFLTRSFSVTPGPVRFVLSCQGNGSVTLSRAALTAVYVRGF